VAAGRDGAASRAGAGYASAVHGDAHRDLFVLPAIVVIVYGVLHDAAEGRPENAFALVFTIPAIVLVLLWWLPPTTRAMAAKRWRRAVTHQGRPYV
jgi:hypothetical protein